MISGYNTDVPHEDVVFHVQTEDKGTATAWIESLVYVGGAILARRRSSYKRVLEKGGGEGAIVRIMDRQHRSLIAEIRGGKFDHKVQGTEEAEDAEAGRAAAAPVVAPAGEAAEGGTSAADAPEAQRTQLREALFEDDGASQDGGAIDPGDVDDSAVEQSGDADYSDLSLDQAILQFLNSRQEQDELVLTVDATTELGLGRDVDLGFRAASRLTGRPVPAANVEVRMISTVAEPLHLAKGETDAHGILTLSFRIPRLQRGSGALIITARSELGAAEMKHLL